MRKLSLPIFLCVLLLATPLLAQEQRGSIEGVVKDSSGAVLPGVTVEARSDRGAVASVTTDATGAFRFPSLLPGTYTVSAKLQGFQTKKFENVEVLLGQIKTLEFAMPVAGVAETVQVTGESPLVDVKQTARATSIRAEQIEMLPKGRDFTSLVTEAPGANSEQKLGGLSIDGASAAENRYVVDGIDTTNVVYGTSNKNVLVDFVDEVQVKSSGYPAEYGGATGGVINVMTKSGTNNFHGAGLLYWQASRLQGVPTQTLRLNPTSGDAEYINYPKDQYNQYEPGLGIGGPIQKDHQWFYVAYQPQLLSTNRTVTFLSDNLARTINQKVDTQYVTANHTAQIGEKLRTRIAYNNSWARTNGVLPDLAGTGSPTDVTYGEKTTRPNWSLSGTADYVAKPSLYFGFRAGYFFSDLYNQGIPSGPRYSFPSTTNIGLLDVPSSDWEPVGYTNVSTNFSTTRDQQTRLSFQGDTTWYGNLGGQHTIKGGVQVDRVGNDVLSGEQGNRVQFRWNQSLNLSTGPVRGTYGYYQVRSNGVDPKLGFITEGNVHSNRVGLFVQDAWTLNSRLTLNLGLRTEDERVPAYVAGTNLDPIKFSFRDKLAPRLGFAWDLNGDGRWKTYANWGIFYDIFKLDLPRGSFGGEKWLEYYYSLDTYDWRSVVSGTNCPPACAGNLVYGPINFREPSIDAIDPAIKPMRSQEFSAGLEHQLTASLALTARYVHKQLDRAIDDIGGQDAQGNETYSIGNPGYGQSQFFSPADSSASFAWPVAKRRYDAMELGFNRRLSNRWALRAGYTLSRLWGNYTGLSQSDENGRVDPNVGRQYDYPLIMFMGNGQANYGLLPTDRKHQFKAQFIFQAPWGTSVGLNQTVASGIVVTRETFVISGSGYPMQYLGRGSDGRTPVYSQTDLLVQHEFRTGVSRGIVLSFNVLNLFNQHTAMSKFQDELLAGSQVNFSEAAFYAGRVNIPALYAAQGVKLDPRFLMPDSFQAPIQARFGVKFLF